MPVDLQEFDIAVGVVGSRECPRLEAVHTLVDKIAVKYPRALIVSGGAKGVDQAAELAAKRNNLSVLSIRPTNEWSHPNNAQASWSYKAVCYSPEYPDQEVEIFGLRDGERISNFYAEFKGAAFARNKVIVDYSQVVCAFPMNRPGGTTNTINHAKRALAAGTLSKLQIWEVDEATGTFLAKPSFH